MAEVLLVPGKVAKRCGVAVSALHFYEQKGLIHSSRNAGNQRRYHKDVMRRIALIKAAQNLGISLEEIKQTLATLPDMRTPTQEDWQQLAQQWRERLDQRIRAMTALRDSLTGCIGCGCLSMKNCPMYNKDDELAAAGPGAVLLNRRMT
ncbi:redox-sensitive transcriptional activator SoxR [Planctobacterium marinum]|uniref:redox-sensitive transcriptional activator SoxR n=1 Tax=Planctobacterium marinum TaxID=1631968 RepID=UPI001E2A03DC|nr:redox-sensitive transcriptional activator SoxR [Planctobacterium marinum]MCC2607012.1 redox-sensitive transcriptional activator SoxR [Planctobacterium marinum]